MIASEPLARYEDSRLINAREPRDTFSYADGAGKKVPFRFFLFADLCVVWASSAVALIARQACTEGLRNPWGAEVIATVRLDLLFLFSVFVVLFANAQGLYEFPSKRSCEEERKVLAETVACSAIVVGAGAYLGGKPISTVGATALTSIISWTLMASWRKVLRAQSIPGLTERRNVLIVGFGRMAHELARQIERYPQLGCSVKGFVSRRRTPRPGEAQDPRLLGTVDEIPEITRTHFIDELLISVPSDRNLVMELTQKAQAAGVQVRVIPDLYEGLATEQPVEYIGPFPSLTLCNLSKPTLPLTIKRLIDVAVSGIALLTLAPVFAFVAVLVKLDSRGPIFFRAVRVGKKGVTFTCYKFRTMVENAEALKSSLSHLNERDGILFKIAADPRLTRIGKYLRKFSIDELPQLWNVFRGEMSLVGPRPPACGEYNQYALEHLCRLNVMPGLTGLWQVSARQDPSFQSYIQMDKEYVDNWSLGLDFKILCRTVGVVLAGTGQ